MKKEIIKRIILDFFDKDLSGIIDRDIKIPLKLDKIITIIGVRRCGKSSLLYSLIRNLRKDIEKERLVYINFDDDRLFPFELKDFDTFLNTYYEMFPENYSKEVFFFLDEIQEISGWEKFVRRLYDNNNVKLFLTGSSSKLLSKEIATNLRGRTISYELYPLSFKEYIRFNFFVIKDSKKISSKQVAKIKNLFQSYFKNGGFPELVFVEEDYHIKILQEYIDLVIYKDLVERYNISNIFLLKLFIKRNLSELGSLLNVSKTYRDFKSQGIKLSRNSLFEYIDELEDSFAFFPVSIFSDSVKKQMKNPKKIYSVDHSLRKAVEFRSDRDLGRLLENILFIELKKRYEKINYFKEKFEVDFICSKNGKFDLYNICYDISKNETREREIRSLLEAMYKLDLNESFLITFDHSEIVKIDEKTIEVIPAWKFLI